MTSDELAAQETEEVEDEVPMGNGACCIDNRCSFGRFPGRREWTQDCREKGGETGQWCPGECTLDIDARPPECVCF